MFMESWILRVCKRPEVFMIPWTFQKLNSFICIHFRCETMLYLFQTLQAPQGRQLVAWMIMSSPTVQGVVLALWDSTLPETTITPHWLVTCPCQSSLSDHSNTVQMFNVSEKHFRLLEASFSTKQCSWDYYPRPLNAPYISIYIYIYIYIRI